jgi:aryl-alcohol dehydrogenase-like predicted oxidoreductase
LLQGNIVNNVPEEIRRHLGDSLTDAMAAIQFVRSTPGVTTALVGMSQVSHVEENMRLAKFDVCELETFQRLFNLAEFGA